MLPEPKPDLSPAELTLVFAIGAVVLAVLLRVLRSVVVKSLAPWGAKLDRWRRGGAEPERDLGLLLGNFLILGFVDGFAIRYGLTSVGLMGFYVFGFVWMVHLPADISNRVRNAKGGPADVHRRGFFLFKFGSVWRRLALALFSLAAGVALLQLVGHPSVVTDYWFRFLESMVR